MKTVVSNMAREIYATWPLEVKNTDKTAYPPEKCRGFNIFCLDFCNRKNCVSVLRALLSLNVWIFHTTPFSNSLRHHLCFLQFNHFDTNYLEFAQTPQIEGSVFKESEGLTSSWFRNWGLKVKNRELRWKMPMPPTALRKLKGSQALRSSVLGISNSDEYIFPVTSCFVYCQWVKSRNLVYIRL